MFLHEKSKKEVLSNWDERLALVMIFSKDFDSEKLM